MSARTSSDFVATWITKLGAAVQPFDGRVSLPTWLVESAREQAERVFLTLDATPIGKRDLGWAEQFIETSGLAFLSAWQDVVDGLGIGPEPWAVAAAGTAARAYCERLDELGPSLQFGGAA